MTLFGKMYWWERRGGGDLVQISLISFLSIVAPTSRHKTTYTKIKC
jgi:hypothetical protein